MVSNGTIFLNFIPRLNNGWVNIKFWLMAIHRVRVCVCVISECQGEGEGHLDP